MPSSIPRYHSTVRPVAPETASINPVRNRSCSPASPTFATSIIFAAHSVRERCSTRPNCSSVRKWRNRLLFADPTDAESASSDIGPASFRVRNARMPSANAGVIKSFS